MKSFRIMTCLLLAIPLAASAGSYLPTAEKKHLITENRTAVSDIFNNNLEKIRNPSITNMVSQTEEIKAMVSENPVVVSGAREVLTKNLEKIHNPSIANMIYQAGDIERVVYENQVAVSDAKEVFTKNLEKIHNPSIANTVSQAAEIKYVATEIQ
ncbi:MAG: hypothetical protein K6L74_00070 [Neptuniibacter sp.]